MQENWIIPCNVKFYDVIDHIKTKGNIIVWKNAFSIKKGDLVYIYLSSPYSEIKYKSRALECDIPEENIKENIYAIPKVKSRNYYIKKTKYMILEVIEEYPAGLFPLNDLKHHDLNQIQIQARTSRILQDYIDMVESENQNKVIYYPRNEEDIKL